MKFRLIGPLVLALFVGLAAGIMGNGLGAGVIAFAVFAAVAIFFANRRWIRRRRLDRTPLSGARRAVLEEYVDFYEDLDQEGRQRFERDVLYFIEEHTITGPTGMEIEDELKVLVGASAAILSFGKVGYVWGRVRDVIIYPEAFDDDYAVSESGNILGQVGAQGPIIFSARALRQGFLAENDGLNVGLHEMAHVLDFGDGAADGVPTLMPWRAVSGWLSLVHDEVDKIEKHRSVLRGYGATNQAEFFAVATEAFFERPTHLREKHPELYEVLRDTYGQDPAGEGPRDDDDDDGASLSVEERRRRRRNERKRRRRRAQT